MILRHVKLHLGQIFFSSSAEGLFAIYSHLTLIVLTLRD
ncbi:putative membrane protein [Shigella flexneri 2747-71]|nr:putative membrane protein [Shigella flexneri 2747-71]EIQ75714.1 putative membrane protein [Shigella flexneri 1235-66]